MNIILHLVRHDVRALRLPLAAWALVLLAQAAVMAFGPGLIDPETTRGGVVSIAGFLTGARLAFTMLLTVLLIQRDSPVGTTAFWLTRPIRPAAMVASKVCSALLLLVLIPAAVTWLLFTALGLPRVDVLAGTGWALREQVMIVALSAMGAVITATIPQFAVAAVIGVLLFGAAMNELRPLQTVLSRVQLPVMYANIHAWVLITVVGSFAVTAYQYSRRRAVPAAAGVAGVLLLGTLSVVVIRGAYEPAPAAPLRAGVLDPDTVRAEVLSTSSDAGTTKDVRGRDVRYRSATAFLQTTGVPPPVILQPVAIESTWKPTGATPIHWQRLNAAYGTVVQRRDDGDEQPNRSIAIGLGNVELLNQRGSTTFAYKTTLLNLREEAVSTLSSAQGPLDATLTLRAWRYRIEEAAPLAVGGSVSARQGRLTVHAVNRTGDTVIVDCERVFLQQWRATPDSALTGALGSAEYLLLRNKSRTEAILSTGETNLRLIYSMLEGFLGGQLGTGTLRLRFTLPLSVQTRVRLDDDWLKGAELVVMRPEDLGVFTRPLRVEWLNLENVK